MLSKLDWIVQMVKVANVSMPKTIIFCDTIYALAQVVNYLTMELGKCAFYPNSSKKREDCLLGIFHSMIQEKYKKRIFDSLKGSGTKRVVIATSALSMGVNFPDVRYVVMYGPPRNLLDFHQQAGRAGRDGTLAHTVLFYYGQQVAHVEHEIREFLNSACCFRVASYKKFDKDITPHSPGHMCCNICSETCACGSFDCQQVYVPHEQCSAIDESTSSLRRCVTEEDKELLRDALESHQAHLSTSGTIIALGSLPCHGFPKEAICDVLDNCHKLFTVSDVISCVPVFSVTHAKEILRLPLRW